LPTKVSIIFVTAKLYRPKSPKLLTKIADFGHQIRRFWSDRDNPEIRGKRSLIVWGNITKPQTATKITKNPQIIAYSEIIM
jgi:hypothetical protein